MKTPHPLRSESPLIVYMDFKSPYAYMALEPTYQLEDDLGIEIDWRPLTLDIPSFLGSARVDNKGRVTESRRSDEQWANVRYAYRDTKRTARHRDIILKGTVKIWDSSLAAIGLMWVKAHGRDSLKSFFFNVYEKFWKRELDIEDVAVIEAMLDAAGTQVAGFRQYASGEGRRVHDSLQDSLHPAGLFGVPSYVVDGQIFFGREHLPAVRWCLEGREGPAPDVAYGVW
ncbi:MAG: DsbA family protein [Gammaproteobacteria bacterium]|nr:DsbA family protein [Gammaproteobacteria bacterium]MDE0367802.1 DsbA family protein [Gammaproteobacteria bacterium]